MMAFLFAWLFSIISAILVYSPECCAGLPAMSLALTALYYLENKLSNFMKSCFKITQRFTLSPLPLSVDLSPLHAGASASSSLPPAGDKVLTAQAIMNNKLKDSHLLLNCQCVLFPLAF
jgi:hypothetical protein